MQANPLILVLLAAVVAAFGCDDASDSGGRVADAGQMSEPDADLPDAHLPDAEPVDEVAEAIAAAGDAGWSVAEVPGFVLAVATPDGKIRSKGWGLADIEGGVPATGDTPFGVGSVSKAILGIAVMQAVEEGHFALDTPLSELGLDFAHPLYPEHPITIEQLVTHTAGIRDDYAYECAYGLVADGRAMIGEIVPDHDCPEPVTREPAVFIARHLAQPEGWSPEEPGLEYEYSNVGAALAAVAFEAGTGVPLQHWTRMRIFEPLGMEATWWHPVEAGQPSARGYLRFSPGAEWTPVWDYYLATWPDGGLRSSARDMARLWLEVNRASQSQNSVLLGREAAQRLLGVSTDETPEGDWQAVFWHGVEGLVGHTGSDPGFQAMAFINRSTGWSAVLLMNSDESSGHLDPLEAQFARLLHAH